MFPIYFTCVCFLSSLCTGNLEVFSVTAALKKYLGRFSFSLTIFYSVMFLISLLFVVIPATSMDVSCAGGTQETWDGAQRKVIFFKPTPWFFLVLAVVSNCISWGCFLYRGQELRQDLLHYCLSAAWAGFLMPSLILPWKLVAWHKDCAGGFRGDRELCSPTSQLPWLPPCARCPGLSIPLLLFFKCRFKYGTSLCFTWMFLGSCLAVPEPAA